MIKSDITDGIATLTLARPEAKNAFTDEMYAAFADTLAALDADRETNVILVHSEGADFCSGNDLSSFVLGDDIDPVQLADPSRSAPARAVRALATAQKPLLAAVEGRAIGFGATLLLHFDHIAMGRSASLIYPFTDIGIVPEAGSSLLIARAVGLLKARSILMDPRPICAEEAVALGLASRLVIDGEALLQTQKTAARWAGRLNGSMKRTKALLKAGEPALTAQIETEFHQLAASLNDPQTQRLFKAMTGG